MLSANAPSAARDQTLIGFAGTLTAVELVNFGKKQVRR